MAALQWNQKELAQHQSGDTPILVDYWAPWCGYCRRIGPAVDAVADELSGQVTVVKIDIDENPELADKEGIEVIPTLVLYRDGRTLGSVVNPGSKAAIQEFIRQTLEM